MTLKDAYLAGGLADGADLMLDAGTGDEVVHMVSIVGHASATAAAASPVAGPVSRSEWLHRQTAAQATATALALLPGVLPTPTANRALWLPVSAPAETKLDVKITPPGRPTIPAILYDLYDWENVDYGKDFPDFPAIGSLAVFGWSQIHGGPNTYNWSIIDNYLANAASMTARLQDGTVISKPIILQINEYEAVVPSEQIDQNPDYGSIDPWAAKFIYQDYTPAFVKNAIAAPLSKPITYANSANQIVSLPNDLGSYMADVSPSSDCTVRTVAVIPKYNNATWLQYYKEMITALAARYNNHPQVVAYVLGPGVDHEYGEFTKDYYGCVFRPITGMTDYQYWKAIVSTGTTGDVLDTALAAWTNKPVIFQPSGTGAYFANEAMSEAYALKPGLKQTGLTWDGDSHWMSNGLGVLLLGMRYSMTTYIAYENMIGWYGNPPAGVQFRYFTILAGLMEFPSFLDFTGDWQLDADLNKAGILDFAEAHLGKNPVTTSDVWVALRDTNYWPPTEGATQYSGWHDDFTFALSRVGESAGINNPVIWNYQMSASPYSLPAAATNHHYSLLARRTDNASGNDKMYFQTDTRWQYYNQTASSQNSTSGAWFDVLLRYVDLGTDTLSLSYRGADNTTHTRTITKRNTGQWITTTVSLRDAVFNHGLTNGADLILSSDPQNGGVDEIVHMVQIYGYRGAGPTATVTPGGPTATNTPTRTPAAATPTATRTGTATPLTPVPTASTFQELRINAGGSAYTDSRGAQWVPDQAYVAGQWGYIVGGSMGANSTTDAIAGTVDQPLYQTERWFGRGVPSSYLFDVPNGRYEVEMRFAEIRAGYVQGSRVFGYPAPGPDGVAGPGYRRQRGNV